MSASSGHSFEVRGEFYRKGKLSGSQDVQYRAIKDRQPVFGFAKTLHSTSASAVFAIGHIRDPYVVSPPSPRSEGTSYLIIFLQNYVTPQGQVSRRGYWSSHFPTSRHAVSFFLADHSQATKNALDFDTKVRADAERVSGDNYAAVVELSTRQAFATLEVTGEGEDDVLIFLKEISSNGDMSVSFLLSCCGIQLSSCLSFSQTVDVM